MLEIWRKIKFLELFITRFLGSEFGGKISVFSNKKQGSSSYRPSLGPKVLIFHEDRYFGPFCSDYYRRGFVFRSTITRFLGSEFVGKIFVFFNKKQGASSYRPSLGSKVLTWDENQFWSLQPFMKWIKDRVLHLHFLKD